MPKSDYDIAIIGGGLAGLSLAIQAATRGHKTVLFEREQYPFHKVCGEYISLESRPFLEKLGVPVSQMKLPVIKQVQTSDVKGRTYQFNLPLGGFGISRYYLDHTLYKIALNKGVNVVHCKADAVHFSEEQFTITGIFGNISARVAAACFGKRSNIDVKLKRTFVNEQAHSLNNFIGVKYHIRLQHDETTIALHNFKDGYCGLSKIEGDTSCLCYLTTAANLQRSNNSITEMEQRILQVNPRLKHIFENAAFLYERPLTISKVSFSKKQQVEDHLLMVGDAAGMITPLCGNGMSMALHASKLAYEAIDPMLCNKISRAQMEEQYSHRWKEQFSTRLLAGRLVQKTFGGNTSTSMFLKMMHSFPTIANTLIRFTHGNPF